MENLSQLPLPGMPTPNHSVEFVDKIEDIQKRLNGEVLALKKCWRSYLLLQGQVVPSNLDTHVMAALTHLELLGMANHITSMLDQMRTLISIWMDYSLTLQSEITDEDAEYIFREIALQQMSDT